MAVGYIKRILDQPSVRALNRWTATDGCWNRKAVSGGSPSGRVELILLLSLLLLLLLVVVAFCY